MITNLSQSLQLKKPWSLSPGNPGTSAPGILGPDLCVERTL